MIRHPNAVPLDRARVMELVAQRCSVATIATRMGVSKQWLNRVIREERKRAKAAATPTTGN